MKQHALTLAIAITLLFAAHEFARADTPPASSDCKVWDVSQAALRAAPVGGGAFLGTTNDGWEPFAAVPVVAGAQGNPMGQAVVLVRRCSKR